MAFSVCTIGIILALPSPATKKKVATEDKFLFEVIVLKKNFLSYIITSHKTGFFGTFIAQYTTVIKYMTDA